MKKEYKIIIIIISAIFVFFLIHCIPIIEVHAYEGFREVAAKKDSKSSCRTIAGFDGLVCAPEFNGNPYDIYSTSHGSPSNKSYGYTNSQGFLEMNSEQLRLLTTRGGNSTNSTH